MLVTPVGITTLVRLEQPLNALSPILITPLGSVTLVSVVLNENALLPIAVTATPPKVPGTVTAPPAPE